MSRFNSASGRIIDALMGKDAGRPHPLSKVWCPAHGDYVQYRDFVPEAGVCRIATWEYEADMRERSQVEVYEEAHG